MTRSFYLLLTLSLLLTLVHLACDDQATGEGIKTLTQTLLALCACLYLYRRVPILGLLGLLALVVLQAWQVGYAIGGLLRPEIDPSPLLGA